MQNAIVALEELYWAAKELGDTPLVDIKSIFVGDPGKIPESNLPALIIEPGQTRYNHTKSGSMVDVRESEIKTVLVLKRKEYYASNYGEDDDRRKSEKVYVSAKAIDIIERTDEHQHAHVYSVVGIIQNNQELPYSGGEASSMHLVQTVDYDSPPQNPRGISTYEVTVTSIATLRGDRKKLTS